MTIDDVAVWLASRPFGPLHRSATGAWTQTTVVGLWTVTCTADEYRVPDSASVAGKSGGPCRIDLRSLEAAVDGHRRAAGTPGSWRVIRFAVTRVASQTPAYAEALRQRSLTSTQPRATRRISARERSAASSERWWSASVQQTPSTERSRSGSRAASPRR